LKKTANKIHNKYFEKHRNNPIVVKNVDKTMTIIGFLGPSATVIQIITIIAQKNVSGISVVTWLIYLMVNISWFLYGFLHKSKPLAIVNLISVITCIVIIAEYFLFKR